MEVRQQCEEFVEKMMIPTFADDAEVVLDKLSTIVGNVLKQPMNEKYRTIPTTNKFIVDVQEKYPQALDYLSLLGFSESRETGSAYVLEMGKENPDELKTGLDVLNTQLKALKGQSSDPMQAAEFQFKTTSPLVTRVGNSPLPTGQNATLEQQVAAEKMKREKQLFAAGIPDRELKVYDKYQSEITKLANLPVSYGRRVDANLLKEAAKYSAEKQARAGKFETQAMRDFETLRHSTVKTKVTIKVNLPDGMVVQANFSPLERLADVEATVKNCMRNPEKAKFYLFKRPKNVKLPTTEKLRDLGMNVNTRLFLAWEDGAPEGEYLKDQYSENAEEEDVKKSKRKSIFGRK